MNDVKRLALAAILSGATALVLNICVILVSSGIFDASLMIRMSPTETVPMPLMNMIPESFAASAVAAVLLFAISRLTARPFVFFIPVVAAITVVSLYGPINDGSDPATKIALSLTHINIADSIIAFNLILFRKKSS
ncbi:MAG: DUF6069 family protein [Spirochaetes bacterium]|jgi:hypothetical protein|nr:DUF6069 family protein [Spirochaetota bacterium]